MGAKVKVWSLAKPMQPTLALVLDHSDPIAKQQQQAQQGASISVQGAAVAPDVNPTGTSNMRWLIKSELADGSAQDSRKKGSTLPDIVAEAIAHAAEDVPEVTQASAAGPCCDSR